MQLTNERTRLNYQRFQRCSILGITSHGGLEFVGSKMPVIYVQNAGSHVGNSVGIHCKDRLHGFSTDIGIEHVKVIRNESGTSDMPPQLDTSVDVRDVIV